MPAQIAAAEGEVAVHPPLVSEELFVCTFGFRTGACTKRMSTLLYVFSAFDIIFHKYRQESHWILKDSFAVL